MVFSPTFFEEIASFATQVDRFARQSDAEELENLGQHPLVRAIGFQESVWYLSDLHHLWSTNRATDGKFLVERRGSWLNQLQRPQIRQLEQWTA